MRQETTTQEQHDRHPHHHGHDVGERLYIHKHSALHLFPAHLKILSAFSSLIIIVLTPLSNWPAHLFYYFMIFSLIKISKVPIFKVLKRATIEIPFIFFAILMPFISGVKDLDIGLISISSEGAYAGGSIIVKATAGTLISVLLGATTTVRSLLRGFTKLRMPTLLVQIATFMLRYVNVISAESERMEVARQSRGFIATGPKHWKVLAQAAGTLFIRSYERGERVHLAMLSRGYVGTLPDFEPESVHKKDLTRAIVLPLTFLIAAALNLIYSMNFQ